MEDSWDDDGPVVTTPAGGGHNLIDEGTSWGRGRGFVPVEPKFGSLQKSSFAPQTKNEDDGWDETPSGNDYGSSSPRKGGYGGGFNNRRNNDENGDNDRGSFSDRRGGRGGRGGFGDRGGRGGFGDRGGRGGFGDRGGRGGFGDRGGRGGGRRNFGDRDNDGDNEEDRKFGDEEKPEKPREFYIPPEPSQDESVMFEGGITSGINFDKYNNIRIKVTGENVPEPISSFESSGLRPLVLDNVKKSKYATPTPVQKHAIPIIMSGRDLMACAQTGSGKTAAFLLPIIHTLIERPTDMVTNGEQSEPQVIIVSPTRELAIQIFNEARKFAHSSVIRVCIAYGGTAAFHQSKLIVNGCHIVVATPGRLMDMVNRGKVTFGSVRYFVLDEADRMLDLGFHQEIEKMLNHNTMVATGERQTLMFSATFPEEIQRLASNYLNNYLFLAVGIVGGACADVEQKFHLVPKFEKRPKLVDLIKQEGSGAEKILVFVGMKRTADFIAAFLSQNSLPTTSIHGDRQQREREEALEDFKSGRMPILVATAVAARGLDIKNVAHVINYDLPTSIDEYVHRIGRTGRVGNRGKATSFYDPEIDRAIAKDLMKILEQTEQEIPSFLQDDASLMGATSSFSRSKFGGTDVRKFGQTDNNDFGNASYQAPQTIEADEEW